MPPSGGENPRICLVTGPPGCGKTTLIRRTSAMLGGGRIAGFVTEEIREAGKRQGFRARGFDGASCIMAHRTIHSRHRVGAYGVDVGTFDRVIVGPLELSVDPDLYIIDEIGKMELKSRRFLNLVRMLVDGKTPILATIPVAPLPLVTHVRQLPAVLVIQMNQSSRDRAAQELGEWLNGMGLAVARE
jgi:nucleoside-triphosphatase